MNPRQRHAVLFQALGHPVRLQILEILSQGPSCVCNLVALTGKRQPLISQHLATLRSAGLVTVDRQGWNNWYQLNDTSLAQLEQLVSALLPSVHNTWYTIERTSVR